jgi:hypothetical protein
MEENMKEEKPEAGKYRYGFDCIRDGMQALKLVQRTLYEMGGVIFPDFEIKESGTRDYDGVRGLSISVELFFSPRLLHEYIAQHPVPEECNGLAWNLNQEL